MKIPTIHCFEQVRSSSTASWVKRTPSSTEFTPIRSTDGGDAAYYVLLRSTSAWAILSERQVRLAVEASNQSLRTDTLYGVRTTSIPFAAIA